MTGKEIILLRKKLELSQKDLANILGVSKNTIWNYENGGKIPESKLSLIERELKEKISSKKKNFTKSSENKIEDIIADKLMEKINPEIEFLKSQLKIQNEKMNDILQILNSKKR